MEKTKGPTGNINLYFILYLYGKDKLKHKISSLPLSQMEKSISATMTMNAIRDLPLVPT